VLNLARGRLEGAAPWPHGERAPRASRWPMAPYMHCRTLRGLTEVIFVALNPVSRLPVLGVVLAVDEVLEIGSAAVGPTHQVLPINPQMRVES
jgi:hypothetical protein